MTRSSRRRFAAKLLFQWRVLRNGRPLKRRICEERIIVFRESSARRALGYAQRQGASNRDQYRNVNGEVVRFEFVGVMDLLELGEECGANEVWYEITERLLPMERRRKLLPRPADLVGRPRKTHGGTQTGNLVPGP